MFIPFNAKFSITDEDYDPLIEDKITTDEALSYVLNMAIRGAHRLMSNGGFTEPESVKQALEAYKADNSTVLSWIEDQELKIDYFLETHTMQIYDAFKDWCTQSGIRTITGKKAFNKEIITKYEFEEKPRQRSDKKRYFVMKID